MTIQYQYVGRMNCMLYATRKIGLHVEPTNSIKSFLMQTSRRNPWISLRPATIIYICSDDEIFKILKDVKEKNQTHVVWLKATNIQLDLDEEDIECGVVIPMEVDLPEGMAVSNYLSDEYDF